MGTTMTLQAPQPGSSLETRPSLLQRLQSGEDEASWRDFLSVYGGLIRAFALKAGLNAEEAEEVLQETMIGISRRLPEFVYDPKVCRFRTWLLTQARWRIGQQLQRRANPGAAAQGGHVSLSAAARPDEGTGGTDPIARIPDPAVPDFGAGWDQEWEKNLSNRALERVSQQIDERQFQIFDLYVTKGWPPGRVAKMLGVSIARVYLTKHRVTVLLKKEVRRLEKEAERAMSRG